MFPDALQQFMVHRSTGNHNKDAEIDPEQNMQRAYFVDIITPEMAYLCH